MQAQDISHQGVVESINGNIVKVNIVSASACSACHAKGSCALSEIENKTIEVIDADNKFSAGESVNVVLKQSLGYKALLLGYIVPFLILVIALIVVSAFTEEEAFAGIIAVVALILYFLALYFFRSKLHQAFRFKVEKLK